jgi:SAM-dependent MidA family methyltransferase
VTLAAALAARIRRHGPISFAEFMDAALYDSDEGFYARSPIGEDRHFVTSPHVSPAFGDLLGRQVAECWDHLGRPRPYTVVEVGAGDGTLARQVLESVGAVPDLAEAVRYVAVERTPGQVTALRRSGLEAASAVADVGLVTGCVIANEVLDNLPFHRLREREGRTVEVWVGAEGDRLVEVEDEPTEEAVNLLDRPLSAGEERPVSPAAVAMVRDLAAILQRGYSFFFDYGFGGEGAPGPVHAYRDQEVLADVLADPGSRDVTAAVDLEALASHARRLGLQAWGPVPQREALLALGYRLWSAGVRARQAEAEASGDWRTATRLFQARSRSTILVDEGKLGGLFLLASGTEGLPPPAAVLGDRETGC